MEIKGLCSEHATQEDIHSISMEEHIINFLTLAVANGRTLLLFGSDEVLKNSYLYIF